MKELNLYQTQSLLKRLPDFELSYETISHKKVSEKYNLCISIPSGKKYFAWFTFYKNKDICYLLDLNKEKKITKINVINTTFNSLLSLGTLVYGILTEDKSFFIIEDLIIYKGLQLSKIPFGKRLGYIHKFIEEDITQNVKSDEFAFILPIMWYKKCDMNDNIENDSKIPDKFVNSFPPNYTTHHLQYRSLNIIMPYLNISLNKKINLKTQFITVNNENKEDNILYPKFVMDYSKPQYKYPTIFQVKADIQFDIYHLYVFGKDKTINYYNIAYIPNYKSSVFMNEIFRNIKENKNLDLIEESDDEDDFENTNVDKYVDLNKIVFMECIFHYKFKKWIPIRVVKPPCKVVHINQLVSKYIP